MLYYFQRIRQEIFIFVLLIFLKISSLEFVICVGFLSPNEPSQIQPEFTSQQQPTPNQQPQRQHEPVQQYQFPGQYQYIMPGTILKGTQNDSMQNNLKILLNYLNDEPIKPSVVQPDFFHSNSATVLGGTKLAPQSKSLFLRSPNEPAYFQQPTKLLVAMAPVSSNSQQLLPNSNGYEHAQKVRRMAIPRAPQQVGKNLLNFLENDAAENSNDNRNLGINYANGIAGFAQSDAVETQDENGEEETLHEADEKNVGAVRADEHSEQMKFSKLKKAVPSDEAGSALSKKGTEADSFGREKTNILNPQLGASNSVGEGGKNTAAQQVADKLANEMASGPNVATGAASTQNFANGASTNGGGQTSPNLLSQGGTMSTFVPSILPSKTVNPLPEQGGAGTTTKHNFKLIYFDARGICEPIRLLFHYAKVPFEDARITRRQWLALKDSTIYGKVPILEVNGKPLTYCHTISRFLARTFGLAGTSSWEQAKVDEISDFHSDVAMDLQPYLYVVAGFHQGDREALRKAIFLPGVEKHFPVYVNLLKQSGSGYFVQSGLTWIDFVISEYMTTIKHFEPAILDKYPALMKFVKKVQSLPQIFDYIANREHQPV